jgi:hypothetical protein
MELPTSTLIDSALTAAGFLAAAGAFHIVQSIFSTRKRTTSPHRLAGGDVPSVAATSLSTRVNRHMEFLQFPESKQSVNKMPETVKRYAAQAQTPGNGQRDRLDVVRMARKMLLAGASHDRIKSVLPISDGELALLHKSATSPERAA